MQMPFNKPPESWNEADLVMLCKDRVPENQRLDYKRELKLEPARERRELLKDITSLANSLGGIVVYGIEEVKHPEMGSVASELCPLQDAELLDRANRIIGAHVSPAVECYLHIVTSGNGGFYIIAHVPQSQFRPHAMVWDQRLDYYIRRNQDNTPMTEFEIREMYRQSAVSSQTLMNRYKELDTDISDFPRWKITSMPTVSGLDLLNTLSVSGRQLTNVEYINMIDGGSNSLQPLVDRFEEIITGGSGIRGTRLFRGGEFLLSDAFIANKRQVLADQYLFVKWYLAMKFFGSVYKSHGYFGPLRIWLETHHLDHDDIVATFSKMSFYGGFEYKFLKKNMIVWIDTTVERVADPLQEANSLIRYFAQGCGTDVDEMRLEQLELSVRSHRTV